MYTKIVHYKTLPRQTYVWICLFIYFLCGVGNNVVYSQGAVITSYSIHEGLSGNGITDIFQDSKGYVWIGTQDGLNRFDGYSFRVYRHNVGTSTSLSGNYITCIKEDLKGNLWIGTLGDGLNKYNPGTDEFEVFNSLGSSAFTLPEDKIHGIIVDSDSSIWIKTENYLVNYNPSQDKAEIHSQYNNVFKSQGVVKVPIYMKSPGLLWMGTKDGITQFNKEERLYERINYTEAYNTDNVGSVSSIIPLSTKSIFVGGNNGVKHLYEQENGDVIVKDVLLPKTKESVVNCAVFLNKGKIWLGTNGGLRYLDYNYYDEQISYNRDNFYNRIENVITDKEITSIIEDKSGLLWVGTKYNGLLKIDFKPKKFKCLDGSNPQSPISGFDIKSLYIDDNNRVWLGTADKGIKIYDQDSNNIYSYPVNLSLYRIGEDKVLSMKSDSKGRLWIGTARGVYIYLENTGIISEFSYLNSNEYKSLLESNSINAIEEDLEGNIWFGTQFGLYKYDGYAIESFFSEKSDEGALCSDEVNALFQDEDGILWVGTTAGINFIDLNRKGVKDFEHLQNCGDSISVLSSNCILSITEDLNNKIWFGTRSGATFYDKKSNDFGYFTSKDGISNDMINGIICDKKSRVWLSTNKGISLINENQEISNFTISDGLPGYVYNRGAVVSSKYGEIFFGGVGGVATINPDSIAHNLYKPNVVLTSIELFHKGKLIDSFSENEEIISLKYKKSSMIRVKFAALEYSNPARNKFQVYLEGFDDDWQEVTSENEIDFSDLPSGDYTLFVKGSNSDNVWSDEPAKISIKIVAPIWMSNYAYAFYLIALVFLVQSIINYRIRHYKSAYKTMEETAVDKQKIEAQRELLSKINQSLTDSIFYAKRIQESILPSEEIVKKAFPDSFVYYRPKDLVSGDFYWLYEADGLIYIAAVDCTGHGVPGAFMSIIAYDMLKSIVTSGVEACPAAILNRLSKEVIKTFRKDKQGADTGQYTVNDGMDISMCVIDKTNRKMSFAGAFNPLYLVRNNEVFVYRADRYPIGYKSDDGFSYSKHDIIIEPNDTYYIFSDGYADQFGGTEGKKFKYRRFRHLLLNIHKLPAEDQKAILHQKLDEWMGEFEQVDDIIVIGMKPVVELV